ncbi:hypothetical protein WAE41_34055, partial [Pseudomonas aeruginosa]|uniref:hypothetical protein n=1 Tax=Pseudomonas aeruginosa TaxID=287 RepID=UPI00301E04F1
VFLVAFCARLKTYGALFGDKNHKAFSRFCLCGHEKSGLGVMEKRAAELEEELKFIERCLKSVANQDQVEDRPAEQPPVTE